MSSLKPNISSISAQSLRETAEQATQTVVRREKESEEEKKGEEIEK